MIPKFILDMVKKIVKSPLKAGIAAFLIWQILKKDSKKKESISNRLEAISIPIEVGDTLLGGKYKNKKVLVKSIGKNEKGEVTINGKTLMRFRLIPKEKSNSEKLNLLKESVDKINLSKVLSKSKDLFKRSQCAKATKFITDRYDNWKRINLNNPPVNEEKLDIGPHIVATNGDLIIDLTAPSYIKHFIKKKQATSWHKKNKDNVKFNATDYKNNMFKPRGFS